MYRFLIVLLVFVSIRAYSQPFANNPIGPISDVPSVGGSGIIYGLNLELKKKEETTEKRTKDFAKEYRKRTLYYTGATWIPTVNSIINNVKDRARQLKDDNEKLSFLFYSKKKENRVYLLSADKQIENMSSNFLNGEKLTILGEKFNLYEELRASLSAINRELDRVDDNIKQSNLKKKLVQQFVK
jgi:hypothetical protein